MVYFTGDVHADIDIDKVKKFADIKQNTSGNVLIVTGDMGLIWDGSLSKREQKLIELYDKMPFTVAFVDGNHENHDRLERLPTKDMWAADVGQVSDNVFHLRRGRVYTIEGQSIWTMGGGFSIDKARRQEFISWWRQEQPSMKEMKEGLYRLSLHNMRVDAIVTHTAPRDIFNKMNAAPFRHFSYKDAKEEYELQMYFQEVVNTTNFRNWFFGHFHDDIDVDKKFHCLYERILDIDGNVILNQS